MDIHTTPSTLKANDGIPPEGIRLSQYSEIKPPSIKKVIALLLILLSGLIFFKYFGQAQDYDLITGIFIIVLSILVLLIFQGVKENSPNKKDVYLLS